jgi:hypothetical protein
MAAGQFVGNMDTWYPNGTQLYNGLLSSIQKRFSRGVSMSANWTWSHCIGYYQGFNLKPEETATNPYNPLFDRGKIATATGGTSSTLTAVVQAPNLFNHLMHAVVPAGKCRESTSSFRPRPLRCRMAPTRN